MSRYPFNLPDIGEGVTEAEIVEWHVRVGDTVDEGQVIAAVMTDKATVELEAPVSGTIAELGGKVGAMVPVGALLVAIATGQAGEETPEKAPPPAAAEAMPQPAPDRPELQPGPERAGQVVLASPAVRKRARALGIDLASVPAHGGQVHHADLDAALIKGETRTPAVAAAVRPDREIPVRGLRRRIARQTEEASRRIPHFTYVEEIDVTELTRLRAVLNRQMGAEAQLQLLPFLAVAVCRALEGFALLNAHYDEGRGVITQFGQVNLGIATQTPAGLMVPVIHGAQGLDIWQLAMAIARLAAEAREGRIAAAELTGSTITISSLGKLGGIAATPIINRPEVAVLAPNRVVERPVWTAHGVEPRQLMNLSISCDHRVVDGYDAAAFVQAIKTLIETPALLFVRGEEGRGANLP